MKAKLIQKTAVAAVAGSFAFSTSVSAVNLTDVPLVVAEVAPPNIMVLFDTSGSMAHVTPGETTPVGPGGAYDSTDSDWDNCPSSGNIVTLDNDELVKLKISSKYPRIVVDSTNYFYSVDADSISADTDDAGDRSFAIPKKYNWSPEFVTGKKACFDKGKTYEAQLTTSSYVSTSTGFYSGHYLNFYFGSVLNGSWNGLHHPGQPARIDVGKVVIDNFIDARDDDSINLGMARFNNGNGASIRESVSLLSSSYKTTVKDTVDKFTARGGTPLAESLVDIGIYFTGNPGEELLLHPNPDGVSGGIATDVTAVFDRIGGDASAPVSPSYRSGVSKVTPIDETAFCEKNYTILMTDGQPSGSDGEDDIAGSLLEDYDKDCLGGCFPGDKKNSSDPSDYLDDVAQALYEMDLRPDVDDFADNEYLNNLGTYIIGFADPGIKDLQLFKDVADQGSGGNSKAFFPDTQADLDTTFEQIIASIFAQESSVASVSFNSGQLESDSAVFQAKFNTNPWSGNLLAYNLNDTTGVIEVPYLWDAAITLDQRKKPAATYTADEGRNVFTFDPTPAVGTADGTALSIANWAKLPHELLNDLYAGPDIDGDSDSTDEPEAKLLLEFLLGDNANEGAATNQYRVRDTGQVTPASHPNGSDLPVRKRLGDIVNSTPVFVGQPELNWPDWSASTLIPFGATGNSYSDFKKRSDVVARPAMMYVGANDGMLHGFDAELPGSNGEEKLAYVPSAVFSAGLDEGLHYLAQQDYAHKFYVDLTPTVSDVFIDTGTGDDWLTILVGGMRAGGRGLFALDITDPAEYGKLSVLANTRAANTVLWEFQHDELGYTYSQPTIAKMPNGRWAAITGNGYNSMSGDAKLFIIYLDGGVNGSWTLGSDYLILSTNSGAGNGLSTPRVVDTDGDLVADRIYAGDLKGNMWIFDVSATISTGTPTHPTDPKPAWGVAVGGNPLFTATGPSSNPQPITSAPILVRNPATNTTGNEPNTLVLFGTGQFLESGDPDTTSVESFYAVWDAGTGGGFDRNNLRARIIDEKTLNAGSTTETDVRTINGDPLTYGSTYKGWYMDLPDTGERVVSESQVRGEVVFFNTIIPDNGKCSPGGTGWLMSVDFETGLAPVVFPVFDADKDGTLGASDLTYVGEYFSNSLPAKSGLLGDRQYTPGSDGTILSREIQYGTGGNGRRLSWEEVYRQ